MNKSQLLLVESWSKGLAAIDFIYEPNPPKIHNLICTGFGDKLIYWAFGQYISTSVLNSELLVPNYFWPELLFLNLPNTSSIEISSSEVRNTYKKISLNDFKILSGIKKNNDSKIEYKNIGKYYFDFSMRDISKLKINYHQYDHLFNGISRIKFKNEQVNQYVEKNFSDIISIHLRRGLFTNASSSQIYLKELIDNLGIEKVKNYYGDENFIMFQKQKDAILSFEIPPDSFYFYLIDKIIYKNPQQKIYISTDLPHKLIAHYIKKYPNNVVTKETYLNEFLNFFHNDLNQEKKYNYIFPPSQVISDLLDFFVLGNSKMMISSGRSQWSFIAKKYRKKIVIDAHKLYPKYVKFLSKI